jgi:hypothetical protein
MNTSDVFDTGWDDGMWGYENVRCNQVGGSKTLSCASASENIIMLAVILEIYYSENPNKILCNSAKHIVNMHVAR